MYISVIINNNKLKLRTFKKSWFKLDSKIRFELDNVCYMYHNSKMEHPMSWNLKKKTCTEVWEEDKHIRNNQKIVKKEE